MSYTKTSHCLPYCNNREGTKGKKRKLVKKEEEIEIIGRKCARKRKIKIEETDIHERTTRKNEEIEMKKIQGNERKMTGKTMEIIKSIRDENKIKV